VLSRFLGNLCFCDTLIARERTKNEVVVIQEYNCEKYRSKQVHALCQVTLWLEYLSARFKKKKKKKKKILKKKPTKLTSL